MTVGQDTIALNRHIDSIIMEKQPILWVRQGEAVTQEAVADLLAMLPRDEQNRVPYEALVGSVARWLAECPGFDRRRFLEDCLVCRPTYLIPSRGNRHG